MVIGDPIVFIRRGGMALTVLSLTVLALASSAAWAEGDIKAGRVVAEKCQVCHGIDGQSVIAEAPNLTAQKEMYLLIQLSAFRSGERKNEMMAIVAPSLSDKEMADVAAYYASIPVTLGK